MSIENWMRLDEQYKKKIKHFFEKVEFEKARVDKEKADLLKPYGGKKYDAPEYVRKQISTMETLFYDDYSMEGKYFSEIAKDHADKKAALIKNDEMYDEAEKRKQLERTRGIER